MTAVFSIPAHVSFVDALAAGLLGRLGGDPMALARAHVLLPNRRAVRALTEAFVRLSENKGLLLPRMTPVGDLGDDSFDRFAGGEDALAPAVPQLQRRLELARLVRQFPTAAGSERSAVEALRLGDELGATLDLLTTEEIAPERLADGAVDADLASHWADTLAFLDIVIRLWPGERAAGGSTEAGTRVTALIDALVARWQAATPKNPVIAAGIVSSNPALGRLLSAVARLDTGMVVLPGLDRDGSELGETRWDAIACAAFDGAGDGPGCRRGDDTGDRGPRPRDSEEHPQFALKLLLARLGIDRDDVQDWGVATSRDGPAERTPLIAAAMAPADASDGWDKPLPAGAFAGVTAIEAATAAEEAQVIALALRQALTVEGRSAALVTPDRDLARRVAAHCRRFGIEIDDSAGTPLGRTPPGALALAMVEAMAQGFAPVALLAMLKHPLVRRGDARLAWLTMVRRLDLALRGVRPPPGLDGIAEQIDRWINASPQGREARAPLAGWWADTASLLAPIAAISEAQGATLPELAAALRETGNALGGDPLWGGVDGRALARINDELEMLGQPFGRFEIADAPALLAALFGDIAVRPVWGGHPRLAILGPLEARLQRADLMILAGLNEGVWPTKPTPDPWLAPAIRARLGLPGVARDQGLAAHDFVQALGARDVLLTRARRDASAPMVPSRLWLRLQAYSGGIASDDRLLALARRLDGQGPPATARRPQPRPTTEQRPREISVTDVDMLVGDPFAFYARTILKLRPLDPLDDDPNAATRGTEIHGVMERWIGSGGGSLERLDVFAEEMLLAQCKMFPLLRALWAPRARRALRWAGQSVHAREAEGWQALAAEAGGRFALANGVTLRGRADRIDRHDDGGLAIIDYKTGTPPSGAQVRVGHASQLALLAAMAERGALGTRAGGKIAAEAVSALAYWKMGGGEKPGEIKDALAGKPALTAADHIAQVLDMVTDLTNRLLLGSAAFRPKEVPGMGWTDYDHLARVAEWLDQPAPPAMRP